jgi:uncharacterized protein
LSLPGQPPRPLEERPAARILALDLVRGVAVLGILAINIGGFAGPIAATLSPHQPVPGTWADEAWFAFTLLVFEGKMRALFTLLFGASMALFIERMDAAGRHGERLQLRRLGWLLVLGYLHFALLWWGDILFLYAACGLGAMALRQGPPRGLAFAAIGMFLAWHATMGAQTLPEVRREMHVLAATASPADAQAYRFDRAHDDAETAAEISHERGGFADLARTKLTEQPAEPITATLATMGETLPLMLLGLALYRLGFFGGEWPHAGMRRIAGWSLSLGTALTICFIALAWSRHFPPVLMVAGMAYFLALPHLLMALGYAALLIPAAPRLARTALGARLIAAGRMAFTNYIAMTVVMTFIFYGWGLGLIGTVPPHRQGLFVLGGWALMLAWSKPWLARFRQGPLEWLWRSLTQWERLPFRRTVKAAR